MGLPLPHPVVKDPEVQSNFEAISSNWPNTDKRHYVGTTNEPAFQNAWVNLDAAGATARDAHFYRSGDRVYLSGFIKNGTMGLAAFTLPTGYRLGPMADQYFIVNSNGAFGAVYVQSGGNVIPLIGNNAYVGLDNISFRAA